jgi:hypothetical protein
VWEEICWQAAGRRRLLVLEKQTLLLCLSFVFEAKVCFGESLGGAEGRRYWNAGVARRVGVLLAGMWSGCVVGNNVRGSDWRVSEF